MIEYVNGQIPNIKGDIVVNAANATGWMGGIIGRFFKLKGVAESIHYADPSIEKISKRLFKKRRTKAGDVIHTTSGVLDYPGGILHAVTMNKPGMVSEISIVIECLDKILKYCEAHNITTVVIPLLGTGTGRLDREGVIRVYEAKLEKCNTLFKVVTHK